MSEEYLTYKSYHGQGENRDRDTVSYPCINRMISFPHIFLFFDILELKAGLQYVNPHKCIQLKTIKIRETYI